MFGRAAKKKGPPHVVDVTNPTEQSIEGKYFIGQTEDLIFGGRQNAWGGLINPVNSGVDLYFDIFTITNFTGQPFTGQIWLSPNLPGRVVISTNVHPSNLTVTPPPIPKVKLAYADRVAELPTTGMNVFDRIVPPNSTLISDSSKGFIILPPGGSFVIVLVSPGAFEAVGKIVLTWWEQKTGKQVMS